MQEHPGTTQLTDQEELILVALAKAGDGDRQGHECWGRVQLDSLVPATPQLRDAFETLHQRGFVELSAGRRLVDARLTYWGREIACRRGLLLHSPVDDARNLQRFLATQGDDSDRGHRGFCGSQLVRQLPWSLARAKDAAAVLKADGRGDWHSISGNDFWVELCALGRATA